MLPILRPFLSMFWAALSTRSAALPAALIHCRQFTVALHWMHSLLGGVHGALVRTFPLHEL
jgi:hypothetical protein